MIVAFSVIFGIFAAYYALLVSPTDRLENTNPLSTLFTISNDGLLPLHAVKFNCAIHQIETDQGLVFTNSVIANVGPPRSHLNPGENSSVVCVKVGVDSDTRIKKAEISLMIAFRPDYWPFEQTKQFSFSGFMSQDGQIHWLPKDSHL